MNYHDYKDCIDACLNCAAICNHCAAEDLKETHLTAMAACIQNNMECAVICTAAAHLMSLGSANIKEVCRVCASFCRKCATECRKHRNEHCTECAEACEECATLCEEMA